MSREAGKGDAPRKSADQEAYADGWDRIFSKKEKRTSVKKNTCPYREEIFGDHTSLCDCDHDATHQCAMDI
jgi:hypothetical protein